MAHGVILSAAKDLKLRRLRFFAVFAAQNDGVKYLRCVRFLATHCPGIRDNIFHNLPAP